MDSTSLISYYANLLILQYLGKPKAFATIETLANPAIICQLVNTVQTLTFDGVPASGSFELVYGASTSAPISWDATNATILSSIQALVGSLVVISVTGSFAAQFLSVTFNNVTGVTLLSVTSNTLETSASVAVGIGVTGIADQGPLALTVQNAFNLLGNSPATGVQLDVLGKYAGVVRSGNGFNGQPIVLNDEEFLQFITIAIIQNSSGSSLSTIQQFLFTYFAGEIYVFDYQNMRMSYTISSVALSDNILQLLVTEGLLPKPMAVGLSVVYAPIIDFFGFRTYDGPLVNSRPFNTYDAYELTWPWLTYDDLVVF